MRRPRISPVLIVVAIFVALAGTAGFMVYRTLRGMGEGLGEALAKSFLFVPCFPLPPERTPDLEIAPGAPGYVASLGMAGPQLHFRDKDRDRTWIAAETWLGSERVRIAVAGYDGPPSADLAPESVHPLTPFTLPMLVVRVRDGDGAPRQHAAVWWTLKGEERPIGPAPAGALGINMAVVPGSLLLWTDDGPRCAIEVTVCEIAWCTLAPDGLVVDKRETR